MRALILTALTLTGLILLTGCCCEAEPCCPEPIVRHRKPCLCPPPHYGSQGYVYSSCGCRSCG
jgi:hypothetical protein